MITEYQSHSGAVNTSTTPSVGYTFVEAASGANNSRQTGMVYPNGRTLTYNYSTGNVDNSISRLSSITDGSTTLESYQYLGLDQAVIRSHPQPGIDLTYVKQSGESNGDAGDQYTGLDRFGRIVDQRWIKTSTGAAIDRFQYGYDRDGNVLYKNNLVLPTRSELYHANGSTAGYDNLNQLTAFARGTLSDTNSDGIPDTIATSTQSQSWTTDGQGNFTSITTNGTTQTRTHDQQNELTGVGSTSLTYDAAGNLKTDELNRTYVYDAWGQLISVSVPNNSSSIQASYSYDALGHRITETSGGVTRDLYYSANWQVIEERVSNVTQTQYVWSPVYVDAMIERDQDTDANGTLDQRLYVQTDANFNVTAITDANGNVQERYQYDPYGKVTVLTPVPPVQGPPGSSGDGWGWITSSLYGWQYFHQGGRQDTATGLLNFRNRDYSTSLMRWTSNDPLGFGGGDTNTYRYVGNGPGNGLDPSGLQDSNLEKKGEKSLKEPTPQLDRDRKGERTNQQKNETEFTEESAKHILMDKVKEWEAKGHYLPAAILREFIRSGRKESDKFTFDDLPFTAQFNLMNAFKKHIKIVFDSFKGFYSSDELEKATKNYEKEGHYRWYSGNVIFQAGQRVSVATDSNLVNDKSMGVNEMMFNAFGGAFIKWFSIRVESRWIRITVKINDKYQFPSQRWTRDWFEAYRAGTFLENLKDENGNILYPPLNIEFKFDVTIYNPLAK